MPNLMVIAEPAEKPTIDVQALGSVGAIFQKTWNIYESPSLSSNATKFARWTILCVNYNAITSLSLSPSPPSRSFFF